MKRAQAAYIAMRERGYSKADAYSLALCTWQRVRLNTMRKFRQWCDATDAERGWK